MILMMIMIKKCVKKNHVHNKDKCKNNKYFLTNDDLSYNEDILSSSTNTCDTLDKIKLDNIYGSFIDDVKSSFVLTKNMKKSFTHYIHKQKNKEKNKDNEIHHDNNTDQNEYSDFNDFDVSSNNNMNEQEKKK